jgi:hypothetical protein
MPQKLATVDAAIYISLRKVLSIVSLVIMSLLLLFGNGVSTSALLAGPTRTPTATKAQQQTAVAPTLTVNTP